MYKFYSKSELAEIAGVSLKTLGRFLKRNERVQEVMKQMNISEHAKLLPPRVVRVIDEEFVLGIFEKNWYACRWSRSLFVFLSICLYPELIENERFVRL